MRQTRFHWSLFWLAMGAATWLSTPARGEPASPEQIHTWVEQLGSERFSSRDQATRSLIDSGAAAIEPLLEGLSTQGLEVTIRGIYVLQHLAAGGDEATEAAARTALEKLAAPRITSAAQHARDALEKLDDLRQDKALRRLADLGAVVDRDHIEMPLQFSAFMVEINDQWRGTVEDLRWLRYLRDVEHITFSGPQVDDRWLTYITGLPNVFVVKIKRANITDAGLAPLKTLDRLQYLRLLYVPLGDGAVPALGECKRVSRLDIYGSKMTAAGADKLHELLAARIDRRNGAFLGIMPDVIDNAAWEIRQVTPGSAADKAGLQSGDMIVKYQGQPVRDFDSLTKLIGENGPGDVVTLEIQRGDRTLVREVKLGEWD